MHQKKAISPIISIIIILLITIAIAGAGYSYLSVYWTGMTSKQIQVLDSYCTSNRATITLRNIGTSEINNSDHEAMVGLFEQDGNTVGMWHLDETDGNASLDSSGQGNTGSIFGNTVLLMHLDEDDGSTASDESSYGNTGSLYGDTVLLMHFDNGSGATTDDETSYDNDGTLQGDLETSGWKSAGCKSDKCLEFDGEGDWVDAGDDESLNFPYSSFSISAWVKSPLGAYSSGTIAGNGATNTAYPGYWFNLNYFQVYNTTGSNTLVSFASENIDGSWHHLIVTVDRSLDTENIILYRDGVQDKNGSLSSNWNISSPNKLGIGKVTSWTAYFNGTIDEAAVYSKVLSQEEVEALYQAGKAKFIEHVEGKSGNAIEFGGAGDYISKGAPSYGTSFSDGSFSISYWFKANSFVNSSGTQIRPFEIATCSGGAYMTSIIAVTANPTSNIRLYAVDSDSVTESTSSAANAISINTWHLYTAVMDRGNNEGRLYIDGAQSGSTNALSWTGEFSCTSATIYFGGFGAGSSFNGTIDEAAIYSRALTGDDINASYQAGKAKFIEHVEGRFGYGMEFDGSGDYVDVSDDASLEFSANDSFTYSLWFKRIGNSEESYGTLIAKSSTASNQKQLHVTNSGILNAHIDAGSPDYTATYSISDNVWYHATMVFNGTDILLYVDGSLEDSATTGWDYLPSNSANIGIGNLLYTADFTFNGIIDEVLIFNRSLSAEEIQAQLKPACSCSGNTCQCGELTVTRTSGEGYFHPYFDNETLSPGKSLTMTDYNCLGGRCEYRITLPTGSTEATAQCA